MLRMIWVRRKKTDSHLRGRRNDGFSLIELSIVLVIIMSVLTLGMGALNSLMTSSAYSETRARQARIKDALVAYYGAHKRLPCPAWGSSTSPASGSSDMRGIERQTSGVCDVDSLAPAPAPPAGFGVVPYTTLGLGRDVAEDGWGNLMSYQVYVGSSSNCTPPSAYTTDINWTASTCFGAGKPGGLWVYDGGLGSAGPPLEGRAIYSSVPPIIDSRAVVVIVSHGKNGFGAWTRQGTQNVLPPVSSCEERMNADRQVPGSSCTLPNPAVPGTTFIIGERPENDDVVAYLTADDVIQRLAKQGDILSATAQANADLRAILDDVKGQAVALTSSTSLPPAFTLPHGISTDPWGRLYRIVPNISSISSAGVVTLSSGTTSPICIYSLGPDGIDSEIVPPATTTTCSAGGDDIVVNVPVSALTTIFNNKGCASSSTC